MYRVIIMPLAETDVIEIGDYIAYELSAPWAAERITSNLHSEISALTFFPWKFPLDEDPYIAAAGIHKCLFENYRIYYRIVGQEIHVLRVLHILVEARPRLLPR